MGLKEGNGCGKADPLVGSWKEVGIFLIKYVEGFERRAGRREQNEEFVMYQAGNVMVWACQSCEGMGVYVNFKRDLPMMELWLICMCLS